jgi:hypothetical protein
VATEEERKRQAAARQARRRERQKLHGQGNHSKCLPHADCERAPGWPVPSADPPVPLASSEPVEGDGDTEESVTRHVTSPPKNAPSRPCSPAGLGPRGARLWDEMAGLRLSPAHVLLLERACRLADRLARLDEQLEGGDWLRTVVGEVSEAGAVEVRVVLDRPLSECRQHEVALKLLVAELRHAGRPATASGGTPPAQVDGTSEGGEPGGNRRGLAALKGGLASGR